MTTQVLNEWLDLQLFGGLLHQGTSSYYTQAGLLSAPAWDKKSHPSDPVSSTCVPRLVTFISIIAMASGSDSGQRDGPPFIGNITVMITRRDPLHFSLMIID